MLAPVPLRDQLDEPSVDGSDENARANCVPAVLSAALSGLTGQAYYGDQLKDAVYGEAYTGATDPARYIGWLADHGVHMWEVRGSGEQLVAAIKSELGKGHPVYGAIPSQWGIVTGAQIAAQGGSTHAVMFCDAHDGLLVAMNPWPVDGQQAFYQVMSEAWWASRLCYGHVYPLERSGGGGVAVAWVQQPDKTGKDGKGHTCGEGVLNYLQAKGLTGVDGLMREEFYTANDAILPLENDRIITVHHDTARGLWQIGEAGGHALAAIWSQLALVRGQVQAAQLENAQLKAQLAAAQQQPAPTPASDPDAEALIAALRKVLKLPQAA